MMFVALIQWKKYKGQQFFEKRSDYNMAELNKNYYKAFGLSLFSEIPLPELPKMNKPEDKVDVVIEIADLSKLWAEYVPERTNFVLTENLLLFESENAKFCIQQGKRIIISPLKGMDKEELRILILGICMGVLLVQRKLMPLHGSAIGINGKAYGFIGESGVGKSTIASAFLSRGFQLMSDDLTVLSFSPENTLTVTPGYPQQKLWQETLKQFGMVPDRYRSVYQRENKYVIPVSAQYSPKPLPLAGIFELVKMEIDEIEIYPIQRLERLQTLFSHTYSNIFSMQSGLMAWHFNTTVNIARQVDFYQLRRPISRFTADDLVLKVLTLIHQEE